MAPQNAKHLEVVLLCARLTTRHKNEQFWKGKCSCRKSDSTSFHTPRLHLRSETNEPVHVLMATFLCHAESLDFFFKVTRT